MKKFLVVFSLLIMFLPSLGGRKSVVHAADPCGNTRGNGQIISVENNSFTLLRNDGRNLIVNLTPRATIETSTGVVSSSDLKIGERVTLVGDDNHDGSFTADNVFVCNETIVGTKEKETGQPTPVMVRNEDTNYEKVSHMIHIITIAFVVGIWFILSVFLRLKKRKSFVYLLFFTIFFIYLYKVFDYTLLQFQSLLLLQHFLPNLMLQGAQSDTNINLIPLATLTLDDVQTSFLNILMMIPFGFGLPLLLTFDSGK